MIWWVEDVVMQPPHYTGEIVGFGTIHGDVHAFLASPCHRHDDGRECCDDYDR